MSVAMVQRPAPLDLTALKERFQVGDSKNIDTVILQVESPRSNGSKASCPVPVIFQPMPGTRRQDLEIHPSQKLEEIYDIKHLLGYGGYGVVRQAKCKSNGKSYAIKSITHTHLETAASHGDEVLFAWRVEHPYLVHLVESFQDNTYLHLVMELCEGGSLEERMKGLYKVHGEPRGLSGNILMRYVWEMLAGIAYLHHHRIVHRDCKPENYMLDKASDQSPLKLIDFGIAVTCRKGQTLSERVGTAGYAAPEVSAGETYNEKCDIWSIGAVGFLCAVGFPAFTGANAVDIMKKVVGADVKFDAMRWSLVKPQMKEIISKMLLRDPTLRPSANNLAEHNVKWLMRCKSEDIKGQAPQQPCCVIS
mmetsp:Transcript_72903/g.152207  ORF Transcript_72903/g.152207 Transcript_72903/m.152207 type:complete len:363 (-) Transcript_72903:78-1166(-)